MASPTKKSRTEDDNSIVGYIHSPSPTKVSKKNTRYFNATLQTGREEYHRVVVFSPQKRPAYEQAALAKTPVKLTQVRRSLSLSDPEGFDVLCGASSDMQVVENLPYFYRGPPTAGPVKIVDVLALGSLQYVTAVRVKVLPGPVVSSFVTFGGVSRELREFRICDRTGQTAVTLWQEKIAMVKVGKCYEMTKLSTRRFKEHTTLTSTPSTLITEIQDVGEPDSLETFEESRELLKISGCVTAVKVSARRQCPRCNASQKEYKERCFTHCCEGCEMMQKASAYTVMYSGTLVVLSNGEEHTLILTNSVVSTFLGKHLSGAASAHAQMQERLLLAHHVEIEMDSDQIVMSLTLGEEEAGVSDEVPDSDLLAEFERLAEMHPVQ